MAQSVKKIILPLYNWIQRVFGLFFPTLHSKKLYKKMIGRKCNLTNPQTLNEKLMYCKLRMYWKNDLVNKLADKHEVRKFVADLGLEHILNPIYGCWDKVSDIEWDRLPERFVLKLNFGSGYNIVCLDKATFNKEDAIKKLKKWMKQSYGLLTSEQGIYCKIKKKIIAERYIDSFGDVPPNDYKFFCSYGEVKMLFVASDRYDGKTKFDYYYPDWKWINVENCHPNKGSTDKPQNFDKMIEYASKLSKRFPLVRIDFYNDKGKIYFGEVTFTHFGCIHPFTPDKFDYEFGKLFPDVTKSKIIYE